MIFSDLIAKFKFNLKQDKKIAQKGPELILKITAYFNINSFKGPTATNFYFLFLKIGALKTGGTRRL